MSFASLARAGNHNSDGLGDVLSYVRTIALEAAHALTDLRLTAADTAFRRYEAKRRWCVWKLAERSRLQERFASMTIQRKAAMAGSNSTGAVDSAIATCHKIQEEAEAFRADVSDPPIRLRALGTFVGAVAAATLAGLFLLIIGGVCDPESQSDASPTPSPPTVSP